MSKPVSISKGESQKPLSKFSTSMTSSNLFTLISEIIIAKLLYKALDTSIAVAFESMGTLIPIRSEIKGSIML